MAIHPKYTFCYEASLDFGTASGWGGRCKPVAKSRYGTLLGDSPCLALETDAIYIQPSKDAKISTRGVRIVTNYNLKRGLEIGDRLIVVRDTGANLGIMLLREEQLIWAFGQVNALPMPSEMLSIKMVTNLAESPEILSTMEPNLEVTVQCNDKIVTLCEGEYIVLDQYLIGLAKGFHGGPPGRGPSIAIVDISLEIHHADALALANTLYQSNSYRTYLDLEQEFDMR